MATSFFNAFIFIRGGFSAVSVLDSHVPYDSFTEDLYQKIQTPIFSDYPYTAIHAPFQYDFPAFSASFLLYVINLQNTIT